jgi:hypothetical protein
LEARWWNYSGGITPEIQALAQEIYALEFLRNLHLGLALSMTPPEPGQHAGKPVMEQELAPTGTATALRCLSAESRSSHQKFECSDGHRRSHPERYQPIAFRRSQ